MIVPLVALAEALAYLGAMPVCAAFCLTTRGGVRLGVGLSAFERRFALRRAHRAGRPVSLAPNQRARGGARLALEALKRLRGMGVSLRGGICLGDAAATALACGALQGLGAALGARAGRVEIDVKPMFDALEPEARLQGLIRVRAGHIIAALARSGIDTVNRRIAQWRSTPSKA